jgi:hypothetical protein
MTAIYAALRNPRAFAPIAVRYGAERASTWMGGARRDGADGGGLGGLHPEALQDLRDLWDVFVGAPRLPASRCALGLTLHRHTEASLAARLGGPAGAQTVGLVLRPQDKALEVHAIDCGGGVRLRLLDCIRYGYYALSTYQAGVWAHLAAQNPLARAWLIRLEIGDLPSTDVASVAFERRVGDARFTLVPDPHYFGFKGFPWGGFGETIAPWEAKATRFLWRGSTTGAWDLTHATVGRAPRVRLCELGRSLGAVADFGITDVVQARSDADAQDIKLYLQDLGMWRDRIPQHAMGRAKFLVEIDGNANSWGLYTKLLLGSCLLKVDSPFEQWFYDRLQPWVHYVPVAQDLSDLAEMMQWCLAHESACRAMAEAGRRLARSLSFDQEMAGAARAFASSAQVAQ